MLKTIIKVRICRSTSLLWRDNCSFLFEKYLKLTPKTTKNPKLSIFQSFYAILVGILTEIKVRICCPVVFYGEVIAVFY